MAWIQPRRIGTSSWLLIVFTDNSLGSTYTCYGCLIEFQIESVSPAVPVDEFVREWIRSLCSQFVFMPLSRYSSTGLADVVFLWAYIFPLFYYFIKQPKILRKDQNEFSKSTAVVWYNSGGTSEDRLMTYRQRINWCSLFNKRFGRTSICTPNCWLGFINQSLIRQKTFIFVKQ